jgi:hypothetical protein
VKICQNPRLLPQYAAPKHQKGVFFVIIEDASLQHAFLATGKAKPIPQ